MQNFLQGNWIIYKQKFFFREFQLINAEGMIELEENSPFGNH